MLKSIGCWILKREIKKLLRPYKRFTVAGMSIGTTFKVMSTDNEWTKYIHYNNARNRLGGFVIGGYITRK